MNHLAVFTLEDGQIVWTDKSSDVKTVRTNFSTDKSSDMKTGRTNFSTDKSSDMKTGRTNFSTDKSSDIWPSAKTVS